MSEADLKFSLLPEKVGGENGNETCTEETSTRSLTKSSEKTNEGHSSTKSGLSKAENKNDSLCTASSKAAEHSQISQSGNTECCTLKLNEILELIEHEINFFKGLQGAGNGQCEINLESKSSDVSSKVNNNATLEEMFKDIQEIDPKDCNEHANLFTEVRVLIKILVKLQDTMLNLLDNANNLQNEFQGIKVLATLMRHLSVSTGSKVTFEEVQKYIDGKKVMDLYGEVQSFRAPLLLKLEIILKYIVHGIRKVQNNKKKFQKYREIIQPVYTDYSSLSDLQTMNDKLRAMTKESEHFLLQYADSISYLTAKSKNFFIIKQDLERNINTFLAKEIKDLFNTEV